MSEFEKNKFNFDELVSSLDKKQKTRKREKNKLYIFIFGLLLASPFIISFSIGLANNVFSIPNYSLTSSNEQAKPMLDIQKSSIKQVNPIYLSNLVKIQGNYYLFINDKITSNNPDFHKKLDITINEENRANNNPSNPFSTIIYYNHTITNNQFFKGTDLLSIDINKLSQDITEDQLIDMLQKNRPENAH